MNIYAKALPRFSRDGTVGVLSPAGRLVTFADPDGGIFELLKMADGTRTSAELAIHVNGVSDGWDAARVDRTFHALDEYGLVGTMAEPGALSSHDAARYASNLGFFSSFASLCKSSESFQERLANSTVLLLGVGGPGSTILLNLAGLGVGRVIVVDYDNVELSNLNRQFVYDEADIGAPKAVAAAHRAAAINSTVSFEPQQLKIQDADQVDKLLDDVDVVFCAMDQPQHVREWINSACVKRGVPMVIGGVSLQFGIYYSVRPAGPCHQCVIDSSRVVIENLDLRRGPPSVNPTLGPMAVIIGGLMCLEGVRYLTGFAPPVAAGALWSVDFATGLVPTPVPWRPPGRCAVCGTGRVPLET